VSNDPRTAAAPQRTSAGWPSAAADDEKDFAATTQRAFEHVVLEMMEE
jgi:predicted NodU family carbamoyl transferase